MQDLLAWPGQGFAALRRRNARFCRRSSGARPLKNSPNANALNKKALSGIFEFREA